MTAPRFFLARALFEHGSGEMSSSELPASHRGSVLTVPLTPEDLHHAADVLRIRRGEELTAAEPDGSVWRLRAEEVSREALTATVIERLDVRGRCRVTLVQGVAKGPKMDRIVEQSVEVGAIGVLPVLTERTVVQLDDTKRRERGDRWRRVARSAAKQARRDAIPEVIDPVPLADALPLIAEHDVVLVVWEDAPHVESVARALEDAGITSATGHADGARVALVIGPEGGLSPAEVEMLRGVGGRTCSLGPTILRTETAGLVALVLTVAALGGFESHA